MADRNAGYDAWLTALENDHGYYLECPGGHGSLPPQRVCPLCGDASLAEEDLPRVGEIDTYSVVHVATPQLADDVPYVTAVASFGPVRLTGFVRGMEPAVVDVGQRVAATVERTATEDRRAVVLRPA